MGRVDVVLTAGRPMVVARLVAAAVLVLLATSCGTASPDRNERTAPAGDPSSGAHVMEVKGCGTCHTISGVEGARGEVGPPLDGLAERRVIAGRLPNTEANLVRWIRDPQIVEPGVAMPDLDLSEEEARDVAAFLLEGGP